MSIIRSPRRRSVTGLRVLLTGAEGAFGTATCELLESAGARVVGLDVTQDRRASTLCCDVSDAAAVRDAVREAAARLGGIDALVNNAGIGTASPLSEPVDQDTLRMLQVNAFGAWNLIQACLPHLLASRGQVVNVASLLAAVNLPYLAAYSASKRALCSISDVLRVEHAADGLTVTTVYPGYVATPIHHPGEAATGMSLRGMVPEETVAQAARTIVRAIERGPRDIATSRIGAFALWSSRISPGLTDRVVALQTRRRGPARPGRWAVAPAARPERE